MKQRKLGPFNCLPIGLGCMNLSHAYGSPPSEKEAEKLLLTALDSGFRIFDTASLYGAGVNERLIGRVLSHYRNKFLLASKCGMFMHEGRKVINGHPDMIKRICEHSLRRLNVDVIDLYYLHRIDPQVPIEDSVGALADLVTEGKIRSIGLSEVSAETIRKAHAVHPIAAVQSEYSLWSRNVEIAVLDICKELDISFVAFSPVARGYLTGKLSDISELEPNDIRRNMPRFEPNNYAKNLELLTKVEVIAKQHDCSVAQLSLAWLLAQGEGVIPIPGTRSIEHMNENFAAEKITLDRATCNTLSTLIHNGNVVGERYNALQQLEIDTEQF